MHPGIIGECICDVALYNICNANGTYVSLLDGLPYCYADQGERVPWVAENGNQYSGALDWPLVTWRYAYSGWIVDLAYLFR
jgi:hypothetical protein